MGKKIGIVVTIENYRTSENSSSCIKPVKYATSDGESIKKMFQDNLGISQEDIFYFKDEQATLATFNGEIQYYIKNLGDDETLFFYYAGHGLSSNGLNRLTAWDTSTFNLDETTVSFEKLFLENFRQSRSKRCIAFIDACASGINDNSRTLIEGLNISNLEDKFINSGYTYAIYCACSPNQKSFSSDKLKHGIWTWHLLNALTGTTEEAFDNGPYISDASLKKYLTNSVMEYIRKDMDISEPQTPYAIISSNNHFRIVEFNEINFSFKNEIESVMEEVYFQCNTIAQEKCLSSRSWGDVRNFTDIIEVCHELQQLNYFDDSYITILSEMQYYYNNIDTLEFDNLSFDKKKKIIKSFNEFLQTFPTYINECYI